MVRYRIDPLCILKKDLNTIIVTRRAHIVLRINISNTGRALIINHRETCLCFRLIAKRMWLIKLCIALNRACLCIYKCYISFFLSLPLILSVSFSPLLEFQDIAKCISRDSQTRVLGVLISSRERSSERYSSWISIGDIASMRFYDAIRVLRSYDDGISIRKELARRLRISRAKGANRHSIGTSSMMNSRCAINSLQEVPFRRIFIYKSY